MLACVLRGASFEYVCCVICEKEKKAEKLLLYSAQRREKRLIHIQIVELIAYLLERDECSAEFLFRFKMYKI